MSTRCEACQVLLPFKYSTKSDGSPEDLCPECLTESKGLLLDFNEEDMFKLPDDTFDEYNHG